jgi:predicted ATPase
LERADIRARQVGHLHSLALGGFIEAQIAVLGGRVDFAREKAENLIKLAEETSMRDYARLGAIIALWARGRRQKSPGAALEFRAAMADYEATGARVYLPQFHGMLADLEASVGALDEALATLDQGLAIAEATGERCVDAFLRRIGGAILVNRNARAAEEAFARAIETARAQQARAFALAAALPLARLYKEERRYGEARDTLTLALKGLAPSAFLPEVDDGRALLAALSN